MDSVAGIRAALGHGLQPLVDLVYPPRCPSCGVAVAQLGGLCTDCWSGVEFARKDEPTEGHTEVIAAVVYNEVSRKLLLSFKHGGKVALAGLLGQMIASRLPHPNQSNPLLLVPVPLHPTRLWHRGYNQSALLAQELARRGYGKVWVSALQRTRRTPSLGGLGKHERQVALKGAISLKRSAAKRVIGRDVLLVDDVFTSGATSTACIDALKNGGARSTRIACFARTKP